MTEVTAMGIRAGASVPDQRGRRFFVSMPLHDALAIGFLYFALWWFPVKVCIGGCIWLAVQLAVLITCMFAVIIWTARTRRIGRDVTARRVPFWPWPLFLLAVTA